MLNNFDALLSALANKQQTQYINKVSQANMTAGVFASLWRATGTPAQGAIPGAAAQCTKALTGAVTFNNPTAPDALYAVKATLTCQNAATQINIFDRIAHMGGLVGNVATSQTVNLVPNTNRWALGDMQWFIEIYTDIGTTATTITVTYTDANDVPGKTITGIAIGSTTNSQNRAVRLIPIFPADGIPIKSIQSCQLAATTGTAGNFGFTVGAQLGSVVTSGAFISSDYDWARLNINKVPNDACIWFTILCNTTSTGAVLGNLYLAAG